MKKYEIKIMTELNQGDLSGIELMTTYVFADSESIAKKMAENLLNTYVDNSNVFKYFPIHTTIGINTSLA